jgi:3'-phosphoadenosine 5'-phosphosulfate sulfotransferase (PAPS reductase)/FAD synthetase/ferredoxin
LWACNKQYFYRGKFVFEVKGANIYDAPTVLLQPDAHNLKLKSVDTKAMLERCKDEIFLLESEAIEFIRGIYVQYSSARESVERVKANQMDYEALVTKLEKQTKQKMAIIKQDCDSFDIMPLNNALQEGKKTYHTTRIDKFLASFSGGKDSQVVLDLCVRAIPPSAFEVIYSDTGYELPTSLTLYKEVENFYKNKFPELKFSTARNHETVLNYWDKIGTPSDTHRWCCSIMKTAPLYRMLKIDGTNKQARVLAFDGVRAEESTRRSEYARIGKGVKHHTVINARPILDWNTAEIFLYLFRHNLPINKAYRQGMTRVGCLICPFSSEWNENIAQNFYKNNLSPFIQRLEKIAFKSGVRDVKEYIKAGNWKRRASGNLVDTDTNIKFFQTAMSFKTLIEHPQEDFIQWLSSLGVFSIVTKNGQSFGELKYKDKIYSFEIKTSNGIVEIILSNCQDIIFIGLLKRVLYKTAYCSHCEVCEVECPTGALSVVPKVKIDTAKCIHCNKCLTFHDKGCIVADSLYQTTNTQMNAQTSIDRYKNFGLKEEWVESYFVDPESFWESDHGLQKQYQVPALRNWLKDAEIIDAKFNVTELGKLLYTIFQNNPTLVWEIIWINLTYNSFIAKWFSARVNTSSPFTAKILEELIRSEFPVYKDKTIHNAVYQIFRTLKESPIGAEFKQFELQDKETAVRYPYEDLSPEAVAYSIYKYTKDKDISFLRVSDFYRPEEGSGVYREFGISKNELLKKLRSLSSDRNRVLIAELNMGLDHITLREDLTPITAIESLV